MADKENEGVEKEMDMTYAGAPESVAKTTKAGSGENLEEEKPEKQIQETKEPESASDSTEISNGNVVTKPVLKERTDTLQLFVGLAQIVASLAAVVAAVLALYTLREMQIERNNAYRPEIVVVPNTFEGSEIVEGEDIPDGKIMYIDQSLKSSFFFYREYPRDNIDLLYLQIPYLTLKNIGQGTARDIQISFPIDWVEEAVKVLNHQADDGDYTFKSENDEGLDYFSLYYSGPDGDDWSYLTNSDDLVKRITYISAEEESVNVPIPGCWTRVLAELYGQAIYNRHRSRGGNGLSKVINELVIPDPVINITYSDMQGLSIEEELVIPWTGQFSHLMSSGETDSLWHLRTGFYEDYLG